MGIAAVGRRAGDEILIPTIARPVLARWNDVTSTQPFSGVLGVKNLSVLKST